MEIDVNAPEREVRALRAQLGEEMAANLNLKIEIRKIADALSEAQGEVARLEAEAAKEPPAKPKK